MLYIWLQSIAETHLCFSPQYSSSADSLSTACESNHFMWDRQTGDSSLFSELDRKACVVSIALLPFWLVIVTCWELCFVTSNSFPSALHQTDCHSVRNERELVDLALEDREALLEWRRQFLFCGWFEWKQYNLHRKFCIGNELGWICL